MDQRLNFPRQPTVSDAGNICICLQQKSARRTCELLSPWGSNRAGTPHSPVRFWGLRLISPEEQHLLVGKHYTHIVSALQALTL